MLLALAVALWLLCGAAITLAPRLSPEARRSAQLDVAAVGALGLATAGFFWPLLFGSNVWMPAGGGDLAGFLYPTYHFAQEWILRGVIPLWNPYIFGGTPFLADIQTALFYPPNLLTYILSDPLTYRDLEYLSVLHFYVAGAGMYALLRFGPFRPTGRPLARSAALAGALAFGFSDLFVTHFGNLNLIATAAWMPLVFLFFARALGPEVRGQAAPSPRVRVALALAAGVLLGVAFFAGHIQPFLMIALALALYAVFHAAAASVPWTRALAILLLTFATTAGLSAITLLPALELTRLSVRSGFTYADATQFSVPPLELVGLLVPGFFGRGPANAWGPWARVEVGYVGVFPLLLAALALLLVRHRQTQFLALLTLAGLGLALGGYAVLHGWLYQFVPGFGQLRAPARFILIMDFGLATLAAIGMDVLVSPLAAQLHTVIRRVVRTGSGIALVLGASASALALGILILGQGQDPALFQRIANAANALAFFLLLLALGMALLVLRSREALDRRAWAALALALIGLDLFSLGAYTDVGTSDPTLGYQRADVIGFLRQNIDTARLDSRTDVEGLWRPDTGLLYRLPDVYGDNPLVLDTFDTFWENTGGRDTSRYALLGVKYVLARRGTPLPSNFVEAFQGGGGITVWENLRPFPRAWLVPEWNTEPVSPQRALEVMADPAFDPARTAILQEPAPAPPSGPSANAAPVQITGAAPNEIRLSVDAGPGALLMLGEVYAPGWYAEVDGQPAAVLRADYLFRAVPVPKGQHQVMLRYQPFSFQLGALVSALTLAALLAFSVWFRLYSGQTKTPSLGRGEFVG